MVSFHALSSWRVPSLSCVSECWLVRVNFACSVFASVTNAAGTLLMLPVIAFWLPSADAMLNVSVCVALFSTSAVVLPSCRKVSVV